MVVQLMSVSPFQHQIRSFFSLPPNEEQDKLFTDLEAFLRARELKEIMVVRGYAGTGKTSVLGAFVKTLKHYKIQVKLMAPTGRAAKVLSLKSGEPASTIHRGIYWRKSKSDLNAPFTLKPNLNKNTVFIVDEASMIGDGGIDQKTGLDTKDILSDLIEHVYGGKGCQLVLIGDKGQLPPVGCDTSPALDTEQLKYFFPGFTIRESNLTAVHRQALNSSILYNATGIRSSGNNTTYKFDLLVGNDVVRITGTELQDELEKAYDEVGREETLIITRSNKYANLYNQNVRGRILWYEDKLCGGDDLMVVKNNYFWQNEQKSIDFIANGEMIRVLRVKKWENLYGFEFCHALISFPDQPDLGDLEIILHTESLTSENANLDRGRMKELFYAVEEDYLHLKSKKERYEAILSDPYFNALQVKYAYAVTCHKAQGGQWERVFIDQGYVGEEDLLAQNRWLYTAVTRASKRLYLVNFSDDQFIESQTV